MQNCIKCEKEIKKKTDIGAYFDTGKGAVYMCTDCIKSEVNEKGQLLSRNECKDCSGQYDCGLKGGG